MTEDIQFYSKISPINYWTNSRISARFALSCLCRVNHWMYMFHVCCLCMWVGFVICWRIHVAASCLGEIKRDFFRECVWREGVDMDRDGQFN